MKSKGFIFAKDILICTIGCFIYSAGLSSFIEPNEISPGGFMGIATAIAFITNIPAGLLFFLLSLPVLILGFIKLGGTLIVKTAIVSLILSVSLEISSAFIPVATSDKVLASLFGGLLMGLGLSLVLLRGATTGGVDIIAKLVNRRLRHLSVGRIILIIDAFVILLASFIYGNISTALYSVIALYAASGFLDKMLYGADKGKIVYVVTDYADKICEAASSELNRGMTKLYSKGGYTGKDRLMLMCVLRVSEVSYLYNIIDKYDENAFVVVSDAGEILGEGFKERKSP